MTSTGPLVSSFGWTWKTPRLDVNAALGVLGITPPPQGVVLVGLISKNNTEAGSFIRFMNIGSSTGSANVTLLQDEPKKELGTHTVSIPANASVQVLVSDVEKALNSTGSSSTLSAYIDVDFKGFAQHIVVSFSTFALTNLTTCSSVTVDPKTFLGNVHTPKAGPGYPSQVLVHNTGTAATKAVFDVYDSPSGNKIGTFETQNSVPPNASTVFSAVAALDAIGFTSAQDNYLVNFKLQSSFTGFAEHIIKNVTAGVITDMSVKCPL